MSVDMEADDLNSHLQIQSYASGHLPTFTDELFIKHIDNHSDKSEYLSLPHVKRWYGHIKNRKLDVSMSVFTSSNL